MRDSEEDVEWGVRTGLGKDGLPHTVFLLSEYSVNYCLVSCTPSLSLLNTLLSSSGDFETA